MRIVFTLLFASLFSLSSFSATGDTTWIRVHNATELTWWGAYNDWGDFPDGTTEYRKILMNYTMGCPSAGCSNWDYTTRITLRLPTGEIDTSIARIDTISQNPVVLDTVYNYRVVTEPYELGRVITPYGTYMNYTSPSYGTGGYDQNWQHTYTFDITDFAHLLVGDSLQIEAFFSGYDGALGFTCTLDFAFIEGTPPREVLGHENLYTGSYSYSTAADFEANRYTAKDFSLPAGTQYSDLRFVISGHGIDDFGCGEFCERKYYVKSNGAIKHERLFWRDDCGDFAIYPQGGTWIFNRGNWCPGDKVYVDRWNITDKTYGLSTVNVDVDLEPWDAQGGTPSYITAAALVSYGDFNFVNDAAVEVIKAPNNMDNFRRYNPMCDNPVVTISNQGRADLSYLEIAYGVVGGDTCWYKWDGNLPYGEREDVTLPPFSWNGLNAANPQFFAVAEWPNGRMDDYPYDNFTSSNFNLVPQYDSVFIFQIRTNNRPEENSYKVWDENGNIVYRRDSFDATTTYRDTLSFSPGCYVLEFLDYDSVWGGGDGLNWWFNTQQGYESAGSLQLRRLANQGQGFVIETINADFGSRVYRAFTVGYDQGQGPAKPACERPQHTVGFNDPSDYGMMQVFPNPSNGVFQVSIDLHQAEDMSIKVFDLMGNLIYEGSERDLLSKDLVIDLSGLAEGIYLLNVEGESFTDTYKLNLSTN